MSLIIKLKHSFFAFIYLLSLLSCTPIAHFNPQAYQNAVNLKVQSLYVMDQANQAYTQHQPEVQQLRLDLEKAYEYAKGIPNNELTTQQWAIMKNENRHLLGGFLKRWQQKNILSITFIQSIKPLIAEGFDSIIGLESGKINPETLKKSF
jgi:hypothetical protein